MTVSRCVGGILGLCGFILFRVASSSAASPCLPNERLVGYMGTRHGPQPLCFPKEPSPPIARKEVPGPSAAGRIRRTPASTQRCWVTKNQEPVRSSPVAGILVGLPGREVICTVLDGAMLESVDCKPEPKEMRVPGYCYVTVVDSPLNVCMGLMRESAISCSRVNSAEQSRIEKTPPAGPTDRKLDLWWLFHKPSDSCDSTEISPATVGAYLVDQGVDYTTENFKLDDGTVTAVLITTTSALPPELNIPGGKSSVVLFRTLDFCETARSLEHRHDETLGR